MNYWFAWIVIASWTIHITTSFNTEDPRPELRHDQKQDQVHQTVFQPIGTYATNVLFTHAVLPVDINLVLRSFTMARNTFKGVLIQTKDSAFKKNIEDIVSVENASLTATENAFKSALEKLPTRNIATNPVEKRTPLWVVAGAILGPVLGLFNVGEQYQLSNKVTKNENDIKEIWKVSKDHSDHLYALDLQIDNVQKIFKDLETNNPAVISAVLTNFNAEIKDLAKTTQTTMAMAHMNKLNPDMFNSEVLEEVISHIQDLAHNKSLVAHTQRVADLFQLPLSYIYQPDNMKLELILHVPMVHEDHLMDMYRFLPLPLNIEDLNYNMVPDVGHEDILAYGKHQTYQVLSANDLTKCLLIADIYYCRGRQVLKTNFKKSCLAGIFKKDKRTILSYCKFQLHPNDEQVFQIDKDTYIVNTPAEIITDVICNRRQTPLHIKTGQRFQLQPGCRTSLADHKIYAEDTLRVDQQSQIFAFSMDPLNALGDIGSNQFKEALSNLQNYSQHIIDPATLINHAFTLSEKGSEEQIAPQKMILPLGLASATTILTIILIICTIIQATAISRLQANITQLQQETSMCRLNSGYPATAPSISNHNNINLHLLGKP